MLIQLRPYQKDIVNKVINSNKSTLIQIPTGGGKTVIAKEIIIDLINNYNKQVLFVAPKIVLMEQTVEVFKGLSPHIVHSNNIYDLEHHLLVSTIQTASRRTELNPDVIIIDEIHYGFEGNMIEKLIKDKHNTRVIGLSATPYDKNGKLLSGFDLILDKYDMKYMINHKFLVPLKTYSLTKPNLENVHVVAGDYNLKELGEVVCNKNTIMEIVQTTKNFIEKSKKTIVFAVDIEHAELLSKAYSSIGFNVKTLHSKLTKNEIQKEISSFKEGYNNTKILVSVLMLTTGFDVPDTDCAVIARPTKSQNLYKQMVGRILRTAKNKEYAVLLDCGNVIENLGMPLEPIKIIDGSEIVNKLKCNECDSENLKLIKFKDSLFWKCNDCGFLKELEQGSYECENCHQLHSIQSDFTFENAKLFLNCDCGYKTIISEYSGTEELVLMEDKAKNFDNLEYDLIGGKYWQFEEARQFVRDLKLTETSQWIKYVLNELDNYDKKPDFIPSNPRQVYIDKWISLDNWLGLSNDDDRIVFNIAREFVRKLKLKNKNQWYAYMDGKLSGYDSPPYWLPREPHRVYIYEWKNFEDWLGIEKKLNKKQEIIDIANVAESLNKSITDIIEITSKLEISVENNVISIEEFNAIKDYIYNGLLEKDLNQIDKRISYEEARSYAAALNLKNEQDWLNYYDKCYPYYSKPTDPKEIYKEEWIDWKDWLGITKKEELQLLPSKNQKTTQVKKKKTNTKVTDYLPFEEAREFARTLNLRTLNDWKQYCKGLMVDLPVRPENIPSKPDQVYFRLGWKSYRDWLTTGYKRFKEAKEFVIKLGIKNVKDWNDYCKGELEGYAPKPHDIPRDPDLRYRKDWKNWEDWLTGDTNKIQGEWRNFNEARKYVRSLNISNTLDWKKYCKGELEGYSSRPSDIPAGPDHAYRNFGWINYADWLGTNNIRKASNVDVWLSFEKAKKFVHNLNLKSYEDWKKYINGDFNIKRPDNIPKSPQFVYKNDGWTNWSDWLGTNVENLPDNGEEEYLPFEEARDFARSLNLYSPAEWRDYIEGFLDLPPLPNNIPKNPREVYKNNGWWGLYDWLGIEKK